MSTYPVREREGKGTIAAGLAAIVVGFLLQAINMQSAVTQAPPQFGSDNLGNMAALAGIAGLLILAGIITTIIGLIRYAQSGSEGTVASASPAGQPVMSTPVSKPAFCSSCGAGIVGEGRFCASCGASTER